MMNFLGKTIIVLGGAGLLGKDFVEQLSCVGANVVVADLDISAAEDVCKKMVEIGVPEKQLMAASVNIIEKKSVTDLITLVINKYTKIDGVINSAYPRNVNYGKKFEDVEYSDFCENINLNIGGYFLVSQQFAEYFSLNGGGDIINISSIYGVIAPRFDIYKGTNMTMPVEYSVIKSSLIHLCKYIAKYYQGKGIRINSISPGGIYDGQDSKFIEKYNSHCGSIGMLSPAEVSSTLLFLLDEKSKGINGQNIIVDDGFTL